MDRRLFLVLPCFLFASCERTPVAFRNTDLTGASFGRGLELSDHNGQRRSLADFHGRVVVIFFGYTSCPDICPTMLARLAEVMKELGPEAKKVQVLFVTLDPERDSLAILNEYANAFRPNGGRPILGLRGTPEQSATLLSGPAVS